ADGDFALVATAAPFTIVGATVTLAGAVTRTAGNLDWVLSATVTHWQPVAFLTVDQLRVTLGHAGIVFDATADIAGFDGVHLSGDYHFGAGTYRITAAVPLDWQIVSNVHLTNVLFSISNRGADDTAGDVHVMASADLSLLGADFTAIANVTAAGFWLAAIPTDPSWSPIPGVGLNLDYEFLVVSSYDFVIDVETAGGHTTLSEVPGIEHPEKAEERSIGTGVNLVAASHLPDSVPGFGGSEVQIAGVIGTSLPEMVIEAKIVLEHPPVIADLLVFESFGLRITGQPSLSIFGQGRILHGHIPT